MNLKTLRKKAKSARKVRPVVRDDAHAVRLAPEAARLAADAAKMTAADLDAANTAKTDAAQLMHDPNPAVSALLEV